MVGISGESEGEGVGLEEGESDLSRLLDDLSELSGELDTRAGHGLREKIESAYARAGGMRTTHSDLNRHDSSTSVSEVAESARNSDGARLGVHAILLVHWRTNILEQVLSGDGDVD